MQHTSIFSHLLNTHVHIYTRTGSTRGTRKLSCCKDDCAMHPIYECPENFRESLTMPILATFPEIFTGLLLPIDATNMRTKFEVRR